MIGLMLGTAWLFFTVALLVFVRMRLRVLEELELPPVEQLQPAPRVSVIIPARNEQSNIETCLQGLLGQTYPAHTLEIIVVDDHSTDETVAIVRKLKDSHDQIRLIEAGPLPEGWKGKSYACWRGAGQAMGEWLCFMDADVTAMPGLLLSAVRFAQAENLDLLSLLPFQEMLGFWERLLMPIAFLSLLFLMDPRRINDPEARDAIAIGHFILVKRAAYDATGGHQTIRSELLDDVALARRFKGEGYRIRLGSGRKLVRTRMYSDLKTLWQGLTRGATEFAGGVVVTTLTVFSSLLIGWMPVLLPCWVSQMNIEMSALSLRGWAIGTASMGSLIWFGAHVVMWRAQRIPLRYLLLLPLSYTALAVVSLESIYRYLTGRRQWKGRMY
jgi:chlorobactene glucosyltransferase